MLIALQINFAGGVDHLLSAPIFVYSFVPRLERLQR